MGLPVKLPDALVEEARAIAKYSERSMAGQIAFWASLGRSLEPMLNGDMVLALKKREATRPLDDCLADLDGEDARHRLREVLASRPYPHFEPHPKKAEWVVRINEDGTRIPGHFVEGTFQPVSEA